MPESLILPQLHPDFESSLDLLKLATDMTADKSKDMLQKFKPQLVDVINKYQRSGTGSNQLSEDDPDWGVVDLDNCVSGDDHKDFLRNFNTD